MAPTLRGLPEVGGVRTLASYVPDDQDAKLAIIGDMALLLGPSLYTPTNTIRAER